MSATIPVVFMVLLCIHSSLSSPGPHMLSSSNGTDLEDLGLAAHPQTAASPEESSDHHGIALASWRWSEYRYILMFSVMVIMAGILKLLFHHATFLSRHLPESCALIVIGIIIGMVVDYGVDSHSKGFPKFTSTLFFNVLLPPIILDAAYSLYDRDFLHNLASVLIFAVLGTLFNVFTIGYSLYLVNYMGWMGDFPGPLDTINCLIFSSLISAVDPVAVLAIFQEIGVNMHLYFLVFGESLLNDGVTVVLYNTMVALGSQESPATTEYVLAFFSFFTVVLGGMAIGTVIGVLASYILKFTKHTREVEPLMLFCLSYVAFILAETIHWSGIISLIACGIVQKRYAFRNISRKSYTTVKYAIKTFASFSDCIIFLFLGIETVSEEHEWHTEFNLWTCLFCLVYRFISIYLFCSIINRNRIKKISYREQFIMAYGGLRGAVGFSLVTILSPDNPFRTIFITTTLFMVFFTVFIQGGTIKLLVEKLKITTKKEKVSNFAREHWRCNNISRVFAHTLSKLKHTNNFIKKVSR